MADKTPAKINVGQRILELSRKLRPEPTTEPPTSPQAPAGKPSSKG